MVIHEKYVTLHNNIPTIYIPNPILSSNKSIGIIQPLVSFYDVKTQ